MELVQSAAAMAVSSCVRVVKKAKVGAAVGIGVGIVVGLGVGSLVGLGVGNFVGVFVG